MRIDNYFLKNGFNRRNPNPTLYIKHDINEILIVCIYVDDLIYIGNKKNIMEKFQAAMTQEFEMTDLGHMHYFLGLEVQKKFEGIFISHAKYVAYLMEKFRMKTCEAITTPLALGKKLTKEDTSSKVNDTLYRSLVGSLMYLTTTRPNIMYIMNLVSHFTQDP